MANTNLIHFILCDNPIWIGDAKEPSLVLILKWGGELTPTGRIQAEELGVYTKIVPIYYK